MITGHTFMFPEGECTITLQDIAILTGLPVNGAAVTGPTVRGWSSVTRRLLGRDMVGSRNCQGSFVTSSWLVDEFDSFTRIPDAASDEQIDWAVRAYLLFHLHAWCFSDTNSGQIGLRILPHLEDLTALGSISWGSAALAHLYREMCLCTMVSQNRRNIGGPLWILQLWAFERLRPFRPRLRYPAITPHLPLGDRWAGPLDFRRVLHRNLDAMRLALDVLRYSDIDWQPYTEDVISQLHPYFLDGAQFWRARVPLIYYHIIEWHQPDRVMAQFGLLQPIPEPPSQLHIHHTVQFRGSSSFQNTFSEYVAIWDSRELYVVQGPLLDHPPHFHSEYMEWYRRISRRWITHHGAETGSARDAMERIRLQSEAGSSIGTYARSYQLGTMEDRRDTQWPPPEPAVLPQPLPHIDPPTVDVQRIRGRRRDRARPHEATREMAENPMPPPVDFHGDTEDFVRQYYGSTTYYGSTSAQTQCPPAASFSVPPTDPLPAQHDFFGDTEDFIRRYPASSFTVPPASVPYVGPSFGEAQYITPLATPPPQFSQHPASAFTPFQATQTAQTPPPQTPTYLPTVPVFDDSWNFSSLTTPPSQRSRLMEGGYIPMLPGQDPGSSSRPTQSPSQMHFSLDDPWINSLVQDPQPFCDFQGMQAPSFSLGLGLDPSSQAPAPEVDDDDEIEDVASPVADSGERSSGPDGRRYRRLTDSQTSRRVNRGYDMRTRLRSPDRSDFTE
ncbi:serine/threonine-protein phosphatase 7 long form homolog [Mercurialis annua]|uniref:serine/threonine-protein phosphatase 7 long form homolog n=2 Tax=Mercurialis annua TaxID=3986 RepID=UPI00215FC0F6|nr:serine/threonine-protein phosphatase 7 long form homolog [Mercurialis annua]